MSSAPQLLPLHEHQPESTSAGRKRVRRVCWSIRSPAGVGVGHGASEKGPLPGAPAARSHQGSPTPVRGGPSPGHSVPGTWQTPQEAGPRSADGTHSASGPGRGGFLPTRPSDRYRAGPCGTGTAEGLSVEVLCSGVRVGFFPRASGGGDTRVML